MTESPSGGARRHLLHLARIAVGLGILAFVAVNVPWEDRLAWVDAGGKRSEVEGEILDDWKGDRVGFHTSGGSVPAAFPSDARAELERGGTVRVERWSGRKGETGYDWKPGMPRIVLDSDRGMMLQALLLFAGGILVVVVRWWRLLALAGCPTSFLNALRLTMLGIFFNSVVPGLTGGDLVKGVLAAKENPGRRADALVSVVVDRALGMIALAGLAAVLILLAGDTFAAIRTPVIGFIVAVVLGALAYAAAPLRRLLRLESLFHRLPFGDKLRSLDQAALLYFRHPLEIGIGLGLSLLNHVITVGGVYWFGRAFGVDASMRDFFVVVPVGNIVSALPLAPMGWGLGEFVYKYLFEMIGSEGALGVAISVSFRLSMTFYGLLGGIYLLLPGSKAEVREARTEG